MSAIESVRQKAIQRNGKSGIRMLVRMIRSAAPYCEAIRSNLREIGLYISDSDFSELLKQFGANGDSLDCDRLVKAVIGKFPSRRETVLAVTTEKLDPSRRGVITSAAIRTAYDVSRHPEVLARRRSAADAAEKFLEQFPSDVSHEEFLAYYAGVSQFVADDKEFDLLLIRQWSLDRPKVALIDAESQIGADAEVAAPTKGKTHPLYQTSASSIGVRVENSVIETKFNRTAIFTKFAPPPAPGSGLNTSKTTSRV
jgi:hypothetical protein